MGKITQIYNKVLRQKAKEVPVKDIKSKRIAGIIKKMSATLAEKTAGAALAAPQIGESLRIFIVDGEIFSPEFSINKFAEDKEAKKTGKAPVVFINPVIKKISKKQQIVDEGCLSVENVFGRLKRAEKLTIEALDESGKKFTRGASGFLAQVIQHEMDHLDGILFIDKATALQRVK
ncbi:peptide deformylase [Patescibacteria group bacterium]|nr:peptide deformylase [Patescibacteria group bacterium]MBU4353667.1 peptide deformylase [Patescibacteria group bacterium]MBU4477059.1 peptide deformylase [Patescibacteria group bacterium]MCG2699189.1 peptide deformylase [Candidatus Parcubacteria bacterium]